MALSNNQIKYLQALHRKKHRQLEQVFLVEGEKIIQEVLQQERFKVQTIFATVEWINKNTAILTKYAAQLVEVSPKELGRISTLKNANQVMAVLKMPLTNKIKDEEIKISDKLNLVLETLQDPGNLGTIIRIADWFDIQHIFCTTDSVELYNPKVIQATMGSFLRVQVHYSDLTAIFSQYSNIPRYGAVLHGESVFEASLPKAAFLVIGNESKGLSPTLQKSITHPITIPKYGQAESLNAGIATGILCAAFCQKNTPQKL